MTQTKHSRIGTGNSGRTSSSKKPRQPSAFVLDIDKFKEFKGMLVRDVNKQTAYLQNPHIDKILAYSPFAQERGKLDFPELANRPVMVIEPPAKRLLNKMNAKRFKPDSVDCTESLNDR